VLGHCFIFVFCLFLELFLNGTLGVIALEDLVSLTASYFFWLESILTAMHIGLGPNLSGMQDPVSLVITASSSQTTSF
jgi:hypothetical protein